MTRVQITSPSALPLGGLARLAFSFVRDQIASLAALVHVLRGHRQQSRTFMEEEPW